MRLAHLRYYWGEKKAALRNLDGAASWPRLPRTEKALLEWIRGKIRLSEGRLDDAKRAFRQALSYVDSRHPLERGRICGSYGLFYRHTGEAAKARYWLEQGLEFLKRTNDQHSLAMIFGNLGHVYREEGRYSEALYCFNQDREIGRSAGDVFGEILSCVRIGDIYRVLRKDSKALTEYKKALSVGKKHPEQSYLVYAMLGMARIHAKRREFKPARDLIKRARARMGSGRDTNLRFAHMATITEAYLERHCGRLKKSLALLEESLRIARKTKDVYPIVRTEYDLARICIQVKAKSKARKHVLEALKLAEHGNHQEMMLWCEQMLADQFPFELATAKLGRYLGRDRTERILSPGVVRKVGGTRVSRTILAGDVRGFTSLSERLIPSRVTTILNAYFDTVTGIIERNGGVIDKFMGDGFLAVFPGNKKGLLAACRSARLLVEDGEELSQILSAPLKGSPFEVGMGIDRGVLIEGEIGSTRRFDYTVIGDVVNTASRLQAIAGGGKILITSRAFKNLKNPGLDLSRSEHVKLKGKARPIKVHRLT